MNEKLKVQTPKGVSEGMPLTDLQELNIKFDVFLQNMKVYNERLHWLSKIIKIGLGIGTIFGIFIVGLMFFVTWKVIYYDVLGNILRSLG